MFGVGDLPSHGELDRVPLCAWRAGLLSPVLSGAVEDQDVASRPELWRRFLILYLLKGNGGMPSTREEEGCFTANSCRKPQRPEACLHSFVCKFLLPPSHKDSPVLGPRGCDRPVPSHVSKMPRTACSPLKTSFPVTGCLSYSFSSGFTADPLRWSWKGELRGLRQECSSPWPWEVSASPIDRPTACGCRLWWERE